MIRVRNIDTLELPELWPYRTMKMQAEHRQQRIFVAEGEKVVQRLLESSFPVQSAIMPSRWLDQLRPLIEKRAEDITVYVAERKALEQLTGFSMYQGLLAVGMIPVIHTLDTFLQQSTPPRLLVAVEGVHEALNIGVLVRSSAAFGIHGFIVGETSSSPYLRRAVRSSMGAIFKMPVLEPVSLVETLKELRRRGLRCVAAHPHADCKTPKNIDFTTDACIVLGNEGAGLSPQVLEVCNESAAIPMSLDVDSLNVGTAGAVFMYEAARQRQQMDRILPTPH